MSDESDGDLLARSRFPVIVDRADERAWRLLLDDGDRLPVSFEVVAGRRGEGTLAIAMADAQANTLAATLSDRELRGIILACTAALGWAAKPPEL